MGSREYRPVARPGARPAERPHTIQRNGIRYVLDRSIADFEWIDDRTCRVNPARLAEVLGPVAVA